MWTVVFVFLLVAVFIAAFILVVGLPYWTQPGTLTLSNAQGSRSVVGKPFTFTSTADIVNLPVFLPSQDGLYTGSVVVHISGLRTQTMTTNSFFLLRQGNLTTVHELARDQYPHSPDVHVNLSVSDGRLFANATNPTHEQTSYSLFVTFAASKLNTKE
jgi:hypothetical protein